MAQTSLATVITSIILVIHLKGRRGRPVPIIVRRIFFGLINQFLNISPPIDDFEYDENLNVFFRFFI